MSQKKLSDDFEPDAERFKLASRPHKSAAAAEEALNAFIDEVNELRVKYQVANLLCAYSFHVEGDSGESMSMGTVSFGNQLQFHALAAFAYGREKQSMEQIIGKLLRGQS